MRFVGVRISTDNFRPDADHLGLRLRTEHYWLRPLSAEHSSLHSDEKKPSRQFQAVPGYHLSEVTLLRHHLSFPVHSVSERQRGSGDDCHPGTHCHHIFQGVSGHVFRKHLNPYSTCGWLARQFSYAQCYSEGLRVGELEWNHSEEQCDENRSHCEQFLELCGFAAWKRRSSSHLPCGKHAHYTKTERKRPTGNSTSSSGLH